MGLKRDTLGDHDHTVGQRRNRPDLLPRVCEQVTGCRATARRGTWGDLRWGMDAMANRTQTYFIRHGEDWHILPADRSWLQREKLIAIHYEPKASMSASDYAPEVRPFVACFAELADSGGYVCATYRPM